MKPLTLTLIFILAGCANTRAQVDVDYRFARYSEQCTKMGFTPKTMDHANCMLELNRARAIKHGAHP